MNWKNLLWSAFRTTILVCSVFDVSFLQVAFSPPKDGNIVHAFEGYLIINTLVIVIAWAILPWPKEIPVQKPSPPAPSEVKLDDVYGQESLEDYLEKRRGKA